MLLKFQKQDGTQAELKLGDVPITLGRTPDADVPILDERASRTHCGIRLWDGEYYVKDLKSKNGTYVNNEKIEMSRLKHGDKIRIGNFIIVAEDENKPGTETLMGEVAGAMDGGKGFKTMLREIVEDVEESENAEQVEQVKEEIPPETAAQQTVIKKKVKTVIKTGKKKAPPPAPEPALEFDEPPAEAEAPAPAVTVDEPTVAEEPPAPPGPPPMPAAAAAGSADEAVDEAKPKTFRLKSKPKRPTQIKINKKPE